MSLKVKLTDPESVNVELNMGQRVMFENPEYAYAVQVNGGMHIQSNGIINLPNYYTQKQSDTQNAYLEDRIADLVTTDYVKTLILDTFFPVNTIHITTSSVNPGAYMGGTWVAWGSGRVPAGVDTAQTEFNTVEKTGGTKTHTLTIVELAEHRHPMSQIYAYASGGTAAATAGFTATADSSGPAGGGQPHNNLQPYITCYMWKRTS